MRSACIGLFCAAALFSVQVWADQPRDPTRPPVVAARVSTIRDPAPVLSAVMGTPAARVAIFNGQLVRGGSSVGSYFIEAVLNDGVVYRHAGITRELHLAATFNPVKKPSATPRLPAGVP